MIADYLADAKANLDKGARNNGNPEHYLLQAQVAALVDLAESARRIAGALETMPVVIPGNVRPQDAAAVQAELGRHVLVVAQAVQE